MFFIIITSLQSSLGSTLRVSNERLFSKAGTLILHNSRSNVKTRPADVLSVSEVKNWSTS